MSDPLLDIEQPYESMLFDLRCFSSIKWEADGGTPSPSGDDLHTSEKWINLRNPFLTGDTDKDS